MDDTFGQIGNLSIYAAHASKAKGAKPIKLYWRVDIERIISDIESLEEMYDMPDIKTSECSGYLGRESTT